MPQISICGSPETEPPEPLETRTLVVRRIFDEGQAYKSSESGNYEVYVQPFPGKQAKWQVSVKGGAHPVWSKDGKELFYIAADRKVMATNVNTSAMFDHGIPKPLFEATLESAFGYDVSRDGKRFLMSQPLAPNVTPSMTLIVNWYAAVKK
jgi:hypothetical protein